MNNKVLIIDFGSQFTQLIARRVREAGVYSEIVPATASAHDIESRAPGAVILSGGPASVGEPGAPALNPAVLRLNVPILAICYGMQLLARELGGRLALSANREYGPAQFSLKALSPLWRDLPSTLRVWMSHGDQVQEPPPDFEALGSTATLPIAAMGSAKRKIYALQFHPEVHHTEAGGRLIRNFLFEIAGLKADWSMSSFIEWNLKELKAEIGQGKVICGLSGGVDSTVTAVLLHQAIGRNLHCVFVDNGLLRAGEADEVRNDLGRHYKMNLTVVPAADIFLSRLAGVTDPEEKRKIIGHTFIDIFDQEATRIGQVDYLAQGTLYPDVIESTSPLGPSAVIKSHHNVGGLPERLKLKLVEPLRELFKDEVREVGRELGLPDHLIWRQPFPGPGLAIRIIGEVTEERLNLLRRADAIVQAELRASGLERTIWQAFAVLLPTRSVGVMGDGRTYENALALRAVTSVDAMTADWVRLPYEVLERLSSRIINEVSGINRVLYDISSKPPSTIEWE